jgi:hypothetical protein
MPTGRRLSVGGALPGCRGHEQACRRRGAGGCSRAQLCRLTRRFRALPSCDHEHPPCGAAGGLAQHAGGHQLLSRPRAALRTEPQTLGQFARGQRGLTESARAAAAGSCERGGRRIAARAGAPCSRMSSWPARCAASVTVVRKPASQVRWPGSGAPGGTASPTRPAARDSA